MEEWPLKENWSKSQQIQGLLGVKLGSPDILREGLRLLWNAVLSGMPGEQHG